MARAKARADGLIERTRTINGKRMHFYGSTVREVQHKIDAAIAQASQKQEHGDMFEAVAAEFWAWKEPRLKYGSISNYKTKVDRAVTWFSGCGMRQISSTDIHRKLSRMAAEGYGYKVIAGQKSVISLIYQYWCAHMDGDCNPCSLLKLPQGLPQQKRSAPTDSEVQLVKAHTDGFGLCAAFMMYAGLRLGEVMALQKRDLVNGQICVTKAVVWHSNRPVIESPKTKNAVRTVPILLPLQKALDGRTAGLADSDYIFGGKTPYTASRYANAWLQYCKSIGCARESDKQYLTGKRSVTGEPLYKTVWVPNFTAHQLRHEFASTLVQCGISPQVAKELMGHADILTTQRWYAEAKQSALEEAETRLNAYFKS